MVRVALPDVGRVVSSVDPEPRPGTGSKMKLDVDFCLPPLPGASGHPYNVSIKFMYEDWKFWETVRGKKFTLAPVSITVFAVKPSLTVRRRHR